MLTGLFRRLARSCATSSIRYQFEAGACMLHHPEKVIEGGEDAFLISPNILAVADGIGSWKSSSAVGNAYPQKLISNLSEAIKDINYATLTDLTSLATLIAAKNSEFGSSTLTILSLNPTSGEIRAYYIGDSLYGVFQKSQVQMVSEQVKYFNCPFQIGTAGDHPDKGIQDVYPLNNVKDAVIVVGSDGLWNNMHINEIHRIVYSDEPVTKRADKLSKMARRFSLTLQYESPFFLRAKDFGIQVRKEGKPDDITVIVAKIIAKTESK